MKRINLAGFLSIKEQCFLQLIAKLSLQLSQLIFPNQDSTINTTLLSYLGPHRLKEGPATQFITLLWALELIILRSTQYYTKWAKMPIEVD